MYSIAFASDFFLSKDLIEKYNDSKLIDLAKEKKYLIVEEKQLKKDKTNDDKKLYPPALVYSLRS